MLKTDEPERLTVSRQDAAAHAAFMAPLQRRPAPRTELPPLQVPQLQGSVPRCRAQEVAVTVEAAARNHVAMVTEEDSKRQG